MPITHKAHGYEEQKLITSILPLREGDPILHVRGLVYTYPDGHQALYDIDFDVWRGEKVALVGPNGAGKSTLMLNIAGILQDAGTLEIAGVSVVKKNLSLIRSLVGVVFQNPDDQLFSPTVYEDVAFGPLHMGFTQEEVHQRVDQALAQVGMTHYVERLSHHLSLGEKKRISIATVLSMSPEILLLDEPTSGIDPRARRNLISLLADLPVTMVVSTHDLPFVLDLLPRTIVLDGGKIVADGDTKRILEDTQLLEMHGL